MITVDVDIVFVLIAWSAGGWFFLWVTTRRREVGLGYGWLMRGVFLVLTAVALLLLTAGDVSAVDPRHPYESWLGPTMVAVFSAVGLAALALSVFRKDAGVAGQRATKERRAARVAAMSGISRPSRYDPVAAEFPPFLDLFAALIGLLAAAILSIELIVAEAGHFSYPHGEVGVQTADYEGVVSSFGQFAGLALRAISRALIGALFLGAVTDAMLLGHWYLVQPGLPRAPFLQLVKATGVLWLPETLVWLWPESMVWVLNGSINDGYNGLLGWFWVACTATTVGLVITTLVVLRERQYAAVMAATGLMYLAIVTAFGQDLVARILFTQINLG